MFQELTIQFTEQCNLSCPYCFAPTKSNCSLSESDFNVFADFCSHENIDVIHITGGEPTLNINFSKYVSSLADITSLVIYTNFTKENAVDEINATDPSSVVFLVNMTGRLFCSDSERENIENNIRSALNKGFRIALGYTFYNPSTPIADEFQYLIGKMKEHHLRNLRISQALNFQESNSFLSKENIRNLYHYVADHIFNWCEEGLSVYFDCPIPPCFIIPEDFKKLRENSAVSIKCIPKVFVMWNLDVTHCYSTMNNIEMKKLSSFNNFQAAKEFSAEMLRKIQNQSSRTGCHQCVYGKDGIPCGCPSYFV